MTIYAEKRRGKLTGRFVVEVTREGRRLRQICENIAEARDTECALRSGEALPKETEEFGLTLGGLRIIPEPFGKIAATRALHAASQ